LGLADFFTNTIEQGISNPSGAFNISTFRSHIDGLGGVMRTNMFQVEVNPPGFLRTLDAQTLSFFCMATNLPGVKLISKSVQRYGYGPLEKMNMGFDNSDITLNFIGDAGGNILNFFTDWIRGEVEIASDVGPNDTVKGRPNQAVAMKPYRVNYKKNYETQITINVFDSTGKNIAYNVTLNKACPTEIDPIFIKWNPSDEFMIIPVRFSFLDTSYYSIPIGFPQISPNGLSYTEHSLGGAISSSVISQTVTDTSNILAPAGSTLDNNPGTFSSGGFTFGPAFTQSPNNQV
jgi:hypothetical protein